MPRRFPTPWSPRQRRIRYTGKKGIIAMVIALIAGAFVVADKSGYLGKAPAGRGTSADMETFDGKSFRVANVVDGDTLDIDVPGEHAYAQRIRLLGVDTPETVKPNTPVQHFGPEASAFAKKTLIGTAVTVQLDPRRTRDKYDRLLAYISLPDGRMFNLLEVEEGYGYADPRFEHPRKADFEKLQKAAMRDGKGLWKDVKNDDLPYYYKDKLKLPKR